MKKIIALFFTVLFVHTGFGQTNSKLMSLSEDSYFAKNNTLNFVRLKESNRVSQAEVVDFINVNVLENSINKVVLQKSEEDDLGFTHLKFFIFQNGFQIANKVILAHCKNAELISLNGDLVNVPTSSNAFSISENTALNFALNKVNAQKYKWENKEEEAHMREALNQPDFTYNPKGTKVMIEKNGKMYSAYQFNIYAETPLYRANVFVNASNGQILDEQNLICTADVPGTAVTKYSGTQAFTNDQNGSLYRLRETQRGLGIETYNMKNTSTYSSTDFTNTTTSWTSTGVDQGATDAHWGAEKTYDYYFTQHNRNSINNSGFKLLSYVHYQNSYQNAFWDGTRMTYGDGTGGKIYTTMDICGHEITHGLTAYTGNLNYSLEPGALNESFSDIFGASIENYARPSNWNWKIAEDLYSNPSSATAGFRSMSNPSLFGDPDTYMGTGYLNYTTATSSNDNGGVHTNSSVGNFWYYLLTTGGSGTNDFNNAYSVTGLGFNSASKIAFRALTVYFTPSTDYITARNLSIQAAKDLFGICSNEVIQTTRAWYAVGVGPNYSPTNLGVNFTSSGANFCSTPSSVNFSNSTSNGLTYTWYFGDGATSTSTNASHTYTAPGVYTVKLKAMGCTSADSITKNAFITVNGPVASPVVSGSNTCANSFAVLNATGSGTIKWYDNQFGGNLLGVGNSFVTPTLAVSTTFYAENSLTLAPVFGGMLSNTGGAYSNTVTQTMIFNVTQSSILSSVVIYVNTNSGGSRTIELRNASNIVLNSAVVNVVPGVNTVTLNFNLNPGTNYKLAFAPGTAGGIYRSTTGVTYPYNIGNSINITGSNAGTTSYYFFYNWKVFRNECGSPRLASAVQVNPLPLVSVTVPSTVVCLEDEAVVGSPAGGTYSGNGFTGSSFNTAQAGLGSYQVKYTYTDINTGCSDTAYTDLLVQECTGISKTTAAAQAISIFPNPAKDQITINNEMISTQTKFVISDASGRLVMSDKISSTETRVDLSQLAKGMYLLTIKEGDATVKSVKLIKD